MVVPFLSVTTGTVRAATHVQVPHVQSYTINPFAHRQWRAHIRQAGWTSQPSPCIHLNELLACLYHKSEEGGHLKIDYFPYCGAGQPHFAGACSVPQSDWASGPRTPCQLRAAEAQHQSLQQLGGTHPSCNFCSVCFHGAEILSSPRASLQVAFLVIAVQIRCVQIALYR